MLPQEDPSIPPSHGVWSRLVECEGNHDSTCVEVVRGSEREVL